MFLSRILFQSQRWKWCVLFTLETLQSSIQYGLREKGAGREIIFNIVDYLKEHKPNVKRYVTLSPKTEMAKKFHLRNGAEWIGENETTNNFEYFV